jgi:chloramphenicol-sensitive protein RarD
MSRGVAYVAGAYVLWGLFPVYFKAISSVGSLEILAHRMAWSLVFTVLLLAVLRNWRWIAVLSRNPGQLRWFFGSAALVTVNWGLFIYAVNTDRIIDASLGYFINPLVNVMIGALVLHERLRRPQWIAVSLAAAGVAWLTVLAGDPPWIGLAIAFSFAGYGLLRRKAPLASVEGFSVEVALLFPLAAAYLLWLAWMGQDSFSGATLTMQGLLALSGPVTAVPLLLFAAGARLIRFTTLGIIQYIAPTLQLILGVWLYQEPFEGPKIAGYVLVWIALVVFASDGLWRSMRQRPG